MPLTDEEIDELEPTTVAETRYVRAQPIEPIVPLELEPGDESRYLELRRNRLLVLPSSCNGRASGDGLRVIPLADVQAAVRDACQG